MSKIIPNSYQCPNFYCDELMHLLSGEEWKVLDYTVRRILGFHKDRDHISLTQYCEGIKGRNGNALDHGTGLSRPTAIEALATLTACKVIVEIEEESNSKGKCYALQLDSDKVDFAWLNARRERKHAATSERTAKARAAAQEKSSTATGEKGKVVNGIDQQVVKPFDQQVVNGIDRKAVNGIDRGVVNRIDPHSIQEKTSGNTDGKRTPTVDSFEEKLSQFEALIFKATRQTYRDDRMERNIQQVTGALNSIGATVEEVARFVETREKATPANYFLERFEHWRGNGMTTQYNWRTHYSDGREKPKGIRGLVV